MLRPGGNDTVRTLATAGSARSTDIYQRYAAGLYRQALLTLGDSALAEHVVRDVIADERAPAPAPGVAETKHDTGYVRASSVPGSCPCDMAALLRTALFTLATSSKKQEKVMRTLGYVTAITMAAAGAGLGVMAVRSLPDVRRYVAMRKM